MRCSECGSENDLARKFCGECGKPLRDHEIKNGVGAAANTYDERRHLTVLFSDLVDSTSIASRLDPEDWRDIVTTYQHSAAEAVARYGGHVAQYQGDGIVVYFGYPAAHEDDAERAIRAGLAIVEAIETTNRVHEARPSELLSVRVGIHTGYAVVSQTGEIFGDTPHIAARAQSAAMPNTVVMTSATYELVSELFVSDSLGPYSLKGIREPIELYRAVQPTGTRPRLGLHARRSLTPFVGRDEELRRLVDCWTNSCKGRGEMLLVTGEPGVGKSRLVQRFRQEIADSPHVWLEAAADPFYQTTPFRAVTGLWQQSFQSHLRDTPEERTERAIRSLVRAGLVPGDVLAIIAPLFDLVSGKDRPDTVVAPDQRRKRLLEVLTQWVIGLARVQPIIIVIEDLQWIDPSSMELLELLSNAAADAAILLLCTARSGYRHELSRRTRFAELVVQALNPTYSREMLNVIVGRGLVSDPTIDLLVTRSGGVPLFLEELILTMVEQGVSPISSQIPASLHDSLTARLDRLGSSKWIAHIAAVLGYEFDFEILLAVSKRSEGDLRRELGRLAEAGLIYASSSIKGHYLFKHALVRDAAYEALLRRSRRQLHLDVANVIVKDFARIAESHPEILARHWSAGGDVVQAITAWRKSADAASARHAFREAEKGYQHAIDLLRTLPVTTERDAKELDLINALVTALQVTRGYAAPETMEANSRARELAEKTGNLSQLFLRMTATWAGVVNAGGYGAAATLVQQMRDLAEDERSPQALGLSAMAQVTTRFFRGELALAEEAYCRSLEWLRHPVLTKIPGVVATSFGYASWTAWAAGRIPLARERIAHALSSTESPPSAYDQAYGQFMAASLAFFLGELETASSYGKQGLALSEQYGFAVIAGASRAVTGAALAASGEAREGKAMLAQSLADLDAIGSRISATRYLSEYAYAQGLCGEIDEGLATAEKALSANPDELVYRPDAIRVRGVLHRMKHDFEAAETEFCDAMEMARKIGAKSWELRAALDLARLFCSRGEDVKVHHLLEPLCKSMEEAATGKDFIAAMNFISIAEA
jgi:class 3 adenylate cyclase/tetratricopeptide (TPR) repeat protein